MVLVVGWKCAAAFLRPQSHPMRDSATKYVHQGIEEPLWRNVCDSSVDFSRRRTSGHRQLHVSAAEVGWVQQRGRQCAPLPYWYVIKSGLDQRPPTVSSPLKLTGREHIFIVNVESKIVPLPTLTLVVLENSVSQTYKTRHIKKERHIKYIQYLFTVYSAFKSKK